MSIKKFLNNIEAYIVGFFLFITLILLTYQVILRWLGASNSWSEEIARYLFVWVVYVGGSYAAAEGAHITITTATKVWPKKIRPYAELAGTLAWIVLSAIFSYYAAGFAYGHFVNKVVSLGLQINMALPYAGVAVGYILMLIRIVQKRLIPQIMAIKTKKLKTREVV